MPIADLIEPTIEEKMKAIGNANSCRVCNHFIRVNFENVRNVMHRQGFCMLGELKGDYGLYVSCGGARECMGFLFSQDHYNITIAEQSLDESEKKFVDSVNDKRSKNYKLIEPLIKQTEDFIKETQNKHAGFANMMAMRKIEITAHEWFRENHGTDYMDVYKMVSLRKSDYLKFLAKISVQIHDEFCKCDKIQYVPEGICFGKSNEVTK